MMIRSGSNGSHPLQVPLMDSAKLQMLPPCGPGEVEQTFPTVCLLWTLAQVHFLGMACPGTEYPPIVKRWGSVAELSCHSQASTSYGIRFYNKPYRPSPTKDVT
jgi:hypothetical protein